MKHIFLLTLLCCSSNIFNSEKSDIKKRDEEYKKEYLAALRYENKQEYLQDEKIRKTREQTYCEKNVEISRLEKKHEREIALYEQKITAMQCQLEDKDRQINQLISNK